VKNIGASLQAGREEKGLSIEDVVRETNIARKYIIALEAEDFSQFPAEAYVLGFLKNYGEYLGLDVNELHNQFKVLKIQEQPVPVNELLNKPSPLPRILITVAIILAGGSLIGGGVYFIVNIPRSSTSNEVTLRKPAEYTFNDTLLEQRFFPGDSVTIPLNGIDYRVELMNLGDVVTLTTPQGTIMLGLNQNAAVDANEDGYAELRIIAVDYAQNKPEMGALLRFEMNTLSGSETVQQTAAVAPADAAPPVTPPPQPPSTPVPGTGNQLIFSGVNPYPFTLQVSFQGYCMLRWEILREAGKQNRNERYFVRGDDINIQAQNGVRLWMSNAGAVKIQAIGGGRTVQLDTGAAGAVVVADVIWRRGDDGRYNLVFSRLEN
jgi:cytoskeletal protein RodZ